MDIRCHQANTPVVEVPAIVISPPNTVLRRGAGEQTGLPDDCASNCVR